MSTQRSDKLVSGWARQAITTRFHGPTDFRGSRVKATCQAGSKTVPWDDALNVEDNHDHAAIMLAESLGWLDNGWRLASGALPDGRGNVYVLVKTGEGA